MGVKSMDFGFSDSEKDSTETEKKTTKKVTDDNSELMQGFGFASKEDSAKKTEDGEGGANSSAASNYQGDELEQMKYFLDWERENEKTGERTEERTEEGLVFRDDSATGSGEQFRPGAAPEKKPEVQSTEPEQKATAGQEVKPVKPVKRVQPSGKHEYQAQEVEGVGDEELDDPLKFGKHIITLTAAGALKYAADYAKFTALKTKFEHGNLVLAYDRHEKPLMYFLESGGALMAYRYLQGKLDVSIPSEVNGMPVKYLHPQFLKGSINPLNGIKAQALKDQFKAENLINADMESIKTSLNGVTSLNLPNTLEMIPPTVFKNCLALKTLVVPASVSVVSVDAFVYSSFTDLYFNGPCPKGFRLNTDMPKGVKVHFRAEYAKSFGV